MQRDGLVPSQVPRPRPRPRSGCDNHSVFKEAVSVTCYIQLIRYDGRVEAATSPALAASEHNTAVVGVMMEVSPVSELPRVLTQENDLWLQKIKTSKQETQSL